MEPSFTNTYADPYCFHFNYNGTFKLLELHNNLAANYLGRRGQTFRGRIMSRPNFKYLFWGKTKREEGAKRINASLVSARLVVRRKIKTRILV